MLPSFLPRLTDWRLLLLMILTVSACNLSGQVIDGKVLDANTGQPIAGAIVVAQWEGYVSIGFGDSQTACFHVLGTTTDENGNYHLPAWKKDYDGKRIQRQTAYITVHSPGYRRSSKRLTGVRYLAPFTGSTQDRLKYLKGLERGTRCIGAAVGHSEKNLLPLRQSLYEEARNIAVTEENKKIVKSLRHQMEALEST